MMAPSSTAGRRRPSPFLPTVLLCSLLLLLAVPSSAFTSSLRRRSPALPSASAAAAAASFQTRLSMSTTTAPPRTDTDTDTRTGTGTDTTREVDDLTIHREGPLEYLEDEWATREPDDPFHILLLGSTFDKPRITRTYVSGSITYVLDMPEDEATELTDFAAENGMSCLGTWEREKCLELGRQLQLRDVICRVVPFVEGGQRGWQAKDAGSSSGSAGAGAGAGSGGGFD